MPEPKEYKLTLFDRHGAAAADYVRGYAFGLMVFGLVFGIATAATKQLSWIIFFAAIICGMVVTWFALGISGAVGWTWKRFMMDGASTPYIEQYSYQQALVMQGKLDEALQSFEAVIAEKPGEVDPRMRAAELYDRDKKNHVRAAELFREVQRVEGCPAGTFIYATNRLVDLYMGPLNQPGKALGELRKLIDRYPGTAAAEHARIGLASMKARYVEPS
jgi:tetratricopeptide (TPR) repeat protein